MKNEQETEGPWYLHQVSAWDFIVVHKNYGRKKYNYQDGVKVVQELNKLEAVREAAPELLEACKQALTLVYECHMENGDSHKMLKAAIAKAETTSCYTKSNG